MALLNNRKVIESNQTRKGLQFSTQFSDYFPYSIWSITIYNRHE